MEPNFTKNTRPGLNFGKFLKAFEWRGLVIAAYHNLIYHKNKNKYWPCDTPLKVLKQAV